MDLDFSVEMGACATPRRAFYHRLSFQLFIMLSTIDDTFVYLHNVGTALQIKDSIVGYKRCILTPIIRIYCNVLVR
jgi:hypothetical protein